MDNAILDGWAKSLCTRLVNEYGFCGYADGPKIVVMNCTDNQGNDLEIKITIKKSE